ncbi:MAG: D-alanyl-D-alanine carboxypeptidase family protein [Eubacteriales bacterium]|nr:D-alanyl-D-alanine carboxypeptidase family protein [Eubacteriales bacterium]
MKKFLCFLLFLPCLIVSAGAYSAGAYAVLDADTGTILDSSNADTRLPMASTTKIMTGLLAAEDSNPNRMISVPAECAGIEGSSMYLQAGEVISLRDVLYGLLLCSGNDAAECIASVCGGREAFVTRMNQRAAELGLSNTHFDNPSGLDGETHYTTATELAQLTAYALKNPLFAEIVSTKDYTSGTHYMHNHNKLLSMYSDCIGVKTGYTQTAGRCLVSAASRDGHTVIAVTLNDRDDWNDHIAMLDRAFSTMHTEQIATRGQHAITLPVLSGMQSEVALVCSDDLSASLLGEQSAELVLSHRGMLYAPFSAGTVCGTAQVVVNGSVVDSCALITQSDVALDESQERLSLWERLRRKLFS